MNGNDTFQSWWSLPVIRLPGTENWKPTMASEGLDSVQTVFLANLTHDLDLFMESIDLRFDLWPLYAKKKRFFTSTIFGDSAWDSEFTIRAPEVQMILSVEHCEVFFVISAWSTIYVVEYPGRCNENRILCSLLSCCVGTKPYRQSAPLVYLSFFLFSFFFSLFYVSCVFTWLSRSLEKLCKKRNLIRIIWCGTASYCTHITHAHTHMAFSNFSIESTKVGSVSVEIFTACHARNEMCSGSLFGLSSLECVYGGCPCSVIHIITIFHYILYFIVTVGATRRCYCVLLSRDESRTDEYSFRIDENKISHMSKPSHSFRLALLLLLLLHAMICTHYEVCHFYFRRST